MTKIYGLIAGVVLAGVSQLGLAFPDPYQLQPQVGGAEITLNVVADKTGINSETTSDSFWYAGTSGVASN